MLLPVRQKKERDIGQHRRGAKKKSDQVVALFQNTLRTKIREHYIVRWCIHSEMGMASVDTLVETSVVALESVATVWALELVLGKGLTDPRLYVRKAFSDFRNTDSDNLRALGLVPQAAGAVPGQYKLVEYLGH